MLFMLFGIEEHFARLTVWLAAGIYYAAAYFFKIFLILSNGELITTSDYELMLTNFYLVIGVVMLFIIAFSLLKGIVNTDDKKSGTEAVKKVIMNFITSMIMIVILPSIFGFAFDFQESVLVKQNTIGKFLGFGSPYSTNKDENAINQVQVGANMIVNGVWTAFFNINPESLKNCNPSTQAGLLDCQAQVDGDKMTLAATIAEVEQKGTFFSYSQFAENITDDEINYNFLLALLGGFILIYVGISYCFDMGVRLVKLVFYQIIAPIPIMLRVIPEGKLSGMFNKWVQVTVTCYLEVFIRIFILYFCVYLCSMIANSTFLSQNVWSYGHMTWLFTKAFIFMGVITFMKQAPKLISEVTGIDSGNMKLGIREKLAAGGAFTAGAIIGGGLTSGVRNATNAIANGKNNWKGASKKEKAGLIAKGIGSTFAGMSSGAYNSGKSGFKAKNFTEMKNAASKGGNAAVKNRENRVDRNNRYKANDQKWAQNFVGGHVLDTWEDIKDYATGGASKYDTIISTGGKFDKQWSKVKSAAGDIKKKKLSDSNKFFEEHIATKMNDKYFKGSNSGEMKSLFERLVSDGTIRNMRELEEYYTSLNNKQIASDSFIKYDEVAYNNAKAAAASSVDRKQFEITSSIVDSHENPIVFDEEGYKKALENAKNSVSKEQFKSGIDQVAFENAQRKLNTEKSLVASMIAQIDKKSTEEVIDLTRDSALGYGLGNSDYLEIQAEKDVFGEMFKSAGGTVTHISIDDSGNETETVISNVSSASNMKDAAEAYKDLASKASGEAKRIEIKKEARKKEDK